MKILVFFLYFIIGFAKVFGVCSMIKHVFRWKVKGYFIFSLCCGGITMLFSLVPLIFGQSSITLDELILLAIFVPMIWVLLTDRSFKSLAVSLSGYVFATRMSMIMILPLQFLHDHFDSSAIVNYMISVLSEAAVLGMILLVAKISKSSITQPMSIWNIIFIALLSYFTSWLTFYAFDAQTSGRELSFSAVVVSLLSIAFISAVVVMTVKLTESRYYSTLNSINESYLNAQKDYYVVKQSSDTEIRRIRHDMKNHLICIRDLASQGKYEELERYINEISDTVKEADRLIHTRNGIVDAIVNDKAAAARKLGIQFEWEGTISGLEISAVDSCTLVANLLDNAIEACEKVDVENRYISLSFRRNDHFLFMVCENSAVRLVELAEGRPISTKSDKYNHGFGLGNIERCVVKYGGELRLNSELREGRPVFIAEAVIPL